MSDQPSAWAAGYAAFAGVVLIMIGFFQAVAGLVAITPCAGFVSGMSPIIIGFVTGAVCFLAISLKYRFRYDDSLDVVGVHLVGGLLADQPVHALEVLGERPGHASRFGRDLATRCRGRRAASEAVEP